MTITAARTAHRPIVEAGPALDLFAAWVAAINAGDLREMLNAQRQLRSEYGCSVCLTAPRESWEARR